MVKLDVIPVGSTSIGTGLYGLFLDLTHTFDLQFCTKGSGQVLQRQCHGIIEPCRGDQKDKIGQKIHTACN